MHKAKRLALFQRFAKDNPNPKTELVYQTHFELLISVILSARATDVSVNKATGPLFAVANTPEAILALGTTGLTPYIKSIGLYPSKARHIISTCQILIEKHGGTVPNQRADLEALPGVGRKTANVVLNTAFGQPTIAVDTHIFRVANRTGLSRGKTVLSVEQGLMQAIPPQFLKPAHHWMVLHGRYVCTARNPRCATCLIHDLCDSFPMTQGGTPQ